MLPIIGFPFIEFPFLEGFLRYVVLWIVPPLALLVLAIGPGRVSRWLRHAWRRLLENRQDSEQILAQVVRRHEKHVEAQRKALAVAEKTEADIVRNIDKSEKCMPGLEREARQAAARGDDLGARAALYKLNLDRAAVANFKEQLDRQRGHIAEMRRRLYLLELQLRQYEVGRSILLSQLAQAKTAEQQYAIANQFDPFSAVASWQRAEGMVQEKQITARAAARVHADTSELGGGTPRVDDRVLDRQLAELKAGLPSPEAAALPPPADGERNHCDGGPVRP